DRFDPGRSGGGRGGAARKAPRRRPVGHGPASAGDAARAVPDAAGEIPVEGRQGPHLGGAQAGPEGGHAAPAGDPRRPPGQVRQRRPPEQRLSCPQVAALRIEKAMITDEVLYRPVADLSKLVQARKISPIELTEAYLARIEALGPRLHAFVTVTADLALQQAR